MKQYTHAWLALKAVEVLKSYRGKFGPQRNERLERLLKFLSRYPSTFVRGAWFPDSVIKDNTQGGHTWKYFLDPANGRLVKNKPPACNTCLAVVRNDMDKKVSLDVKISDLPDRCEALSQAIRDQILITNSLERGDIVAFNDSQVALLFLMLSHYVCDAHVPVHCDNRDFYKPSKIHPDLEAFWEKEICKYYKLSKKTKQFDLDEEQNLQVDKTKRKYSGSVLDRCDDLLAANTWHDVNLDEKEWHATMGKDNRNLWDYLVSVCHVSFHMSIKMFPITPPAGVDYDTIRIKDEPSLLKAMMDYSPHILADAINSVAIVWLATWERWELLKKGIR